LAPSAAGWLTIRAQEGCAKVTDDFRQCQRASAEGAGRRGGAIIRHDSGESRRLYLGLGANLGDRPGQLAKGLEMLEQQGVATLRVSPVYETEPVGRRHQPGFLNLVVEVTTGLSSKEVMRAALETEHRAGRVRTLAGGPRLLDVDLLLDGDQVISEEGLEIPHPRLHLRRFVLVPLVDLAPEFRHPVLGVTMADLLAACPDKGAVAPCTAPLPDRLACGVREDRSIMTGSP
jgi:2-amino-4-hydroxy-6-hydroxymethyldihydropteridine diphosphokinase